MKKILYNTDKGYLIKLKEDTPYFDSAIKWYRVFGAKLNFWPLIYMAQRNKEIDFG